MHLVICKNLFIDVVNFLGRAQDDSLRTSLGKHCLEMPAVPSLGQTKIYSNKLSAIRPDPVSVSSLVEDLGYKDDYVSYLQRGGDIGKALRKVKLNS